MNRLRLTLVVLGLVVVGIEGQSLAQDSSQSTQKAPANQASKQAAKLNEQGVRYLYKTWANTFMDQDVAMWQKLTCAHQQRKIRNELVSKRRDFPQDTFISGAPNLISLENLEVVSLTQNGISAKALFFGDLQLIQKDSKIPAILAKKSLYAIDFYAEEGWWKIAQAGIFDLRYQPELKKQLLQHQFEPIQLPIPSQLPQLDPLVSKADYIGNAWVKAQGVEIDLEINGIRLASVTETQEARLILGGLKLGSNTISYRIKTMDTAVNSNLVAAIEVFALSEKRGNTPVKIWSLQQIKDKGQVDAQGFYKATFELNSQTAKALNIE